MQYEIYASGDSDRVVNYIDVSDINSAEVRQLCREGKIVRFFLTESIDGVTKDLTAQDSNLECFRVQRFG